MYDVQTFRPFLKIVLTAIFLALISKAKKTVSKQKTALFILDGWGIGTVPASDAILQADTPFFDHLISNYPHSQLITYGEKVGLPEGQMGNSEVGHLNIGAGRVVYQDFAKINRAIEDDELKKNPVLTEHADAAIAAHKPIHLFGLLSDGGVHSHILHLFNLIEILEDRGATQIYIHAFLDGRDTSPNGGLDYMTRLLDFLEDRHAKVASVIGRYYAMDRDLRWDRIKLAYDLMVHGTGNITTDFTASIKEQYEKGITDEFMIPLLAKDENGAPLATIADGDTIICFNFRTDRPRQISQVLTQSDLPDHGMKKLNLTYLAMTRYDADFKDLHVLFEKDNLTNTLGAVLSAHGRTQVRIAETEKYPHVTYFFSGGREEPFAGEERIVVASPKVATYDLQPSMSAAEVTRLLAEHVQTKEPDFICLNFANADMVGHTGVFAAVEAACACVDDCLTTLVPLLLEAGYAILVIADHGNSDFMINQDGSPNTAHTTNMVPCILVSNDHQDATLRDGKLADIAPTLLHLMDIPLPREMTGENLLEKA